MVRRNDQPHHAPEKLQHQSLTALHLKHLHNLETRFNYPQEFLSSEFQYTDDSSRMKIDTLGLKRASRQLGEGRGCVLIKSRCPLTG